MTSNSLSKFILVLWIALTLPVFATSEVDLLSAFGIEVFEIDPNKQKEVEEQRQAERNANLPPYILPETLNEDAELDAVSLDRPREPTWESVEFEVMLKASESRQCCLKAIRSSRYEVENRCIESGRRIWELESIPVHYAEKPSISSHNLCEVYHNENSKKILEAAIEKENSVDLFTPDSHILIYHYVCRARSRAKCFEPVGENAAFANDDLILMEQ